MLKFNTFKTSNSLSGFGFLKLTFGIYLLFGNCYLVLSFLKEGIEQKILS